VDVRGGTKEVRDIEDSQLTEVASRNHHQHLRHPNHLPIVAYLLHPLLLHSNLNKIKNICNQRLKLVINFPRNREIDSLFRTLQIHHPLLEFRVVLWWGSYCGS
jgi:hypothetical protein